jgi:hypothetical protein
MNVLMVFLGIALQQQREQVHSLNRLVFMHRVQSMLFRFAIGSDFAFCQFRDPFRAVRMIPFITVGVVCDGL